MLAKVSRSVGAQPVAHVIKIDLLSEFIFFVKPWKPNYRIVLPFIVPNGGIRGKLVLTPVLVHS